MLRTKIPSFAYTVVKKSKTGGFGRMLRQPQTPKWYVECGCHMPLSLCDCSCGSTVENNKKSIYLLNKHRIIDDRIDKYESYIVFVSK